MINSYLLLFSHLESYDILSVRDLRGSEHKLTISRRLNDKQTLHVQVVTKLGAVLQDRVIDGYLMNVLVIRPELQSEFIAICSVGASSQAYQISLFSLDLRLNTIFREVALPTGFSYLPSVTMKRSHLQIEYDMRRVRRVSSHRIWRWSSTRRKFERNLR